MQKLFVFNLFKWQNIYVYISEPSITIDIENGPHAIEDPNMPNANVTVEVSCNGSDDETIVSCVCQLDE